MSQRTAVLVALLLASAAIAGDDLPPTPKRPVVDTYHGVAVTDDYRWLEDGTNPEVRAWSDAQSARTRAFLDALPAVDKIRARITELMTKQSVTYRGLTARGDTLFALKFVPSKQQPLLVTMKAPGDVATERVVLDVGALDAKGTTSMDFYEPSLDGKLVAVSLSSRGSESGDVHVYDVATGKELGDVVPRVNGGTAGGSVAWNADRSGFWYTRYPREGERPAEDLHFFQQVWFHELGTPGEKDRYEVGKEFPKIAEVQLETDERGVYVLADVRNGDGGEHGFWVREPDGKWKQLTGFEDGVVQASIDSLGTLHLLSRKGAPRGKILRADVAHCDADKCEAVVVAGGDATIEHFVATRDRLYVVDQLGGPEGVRVFVRKEMGYVERLSVDLPPLSSVDQVVRVGDDKALIRSQSYVAPGVWQSLTGIRWSPESIQVDLEKLSLSDPTAIDFSDVECVREWAVSKDGTKVPMSICRPKGAKLDGGNPTILYGYGGYGICMTPRYRPVLKAWVEQGGVNVVAHVRGGGEFGEEWHLGGNLLNKQNVFDDFAACAKRLQELGYCKPDKLALMGGSNGGLLMGALITQHPGICRAVVSSVGLYDMLRVELTPNGLFNTTEFGTVKDPAQFKALHAYSPYHRVVDGTAYPSVLFSTGQNDPRVNPYESRKMTARLQSATSSKNPILLRTNANAGHGGGTPLNARIEQEVDVHAFLFHELGVEYREPPAAK